jgi:hypothetical protein
MEYSNTKVFHYHNILNQHWEGTLGLPQTQPTRNYKE